MTAPSKRKPARWSPFEEAWSLPLERGSYANLCVSEPYVFVDDQAVAAHDVATGRRVWAYPVHGRVVAAGGGTLVVDTGRGENHVVETTTGQPRLTFWSALATASRFDPGRRRVAHVGKILVQLGTHDEHERVMLRAMDLESGRRLWTHWPEAWPEGIAASATKVVMTVPERKLVAFHIADGRLCWEHACKASGAPLVDAGRAFVTSFASGSVSTDALDLETGRRLWTIRRRLDWASAGKVYALSEDDTRIESWDAATGRRTRAADLAIDRPPSLRQHTPISILLMSETLVFLGGMRDASAGRHSLLCLDRGTGQMWGHACPDVGEVYAPVLTATGFCYRTSGHVYGFRRA